MRKGLPKIVTLVAAVWFLTCPALAQDSAPPTTENWPQWRGPLGNGVAPGGDPPTRWSETEHIKWKVEIPGRGSATPVVWKDQVFVLTAVEKPAGLVQFIVLCLKLDSGEVIWKQVANELVPHEGYRQGDNSFASGSPITDGRYLYASFGSYGIYCYDLDGNLRWERDLGNMQTRRGFGEGASPMLYGDYLVVPWDHEGPSFITALDAATGESRWTVQRDELTTWATPLVVEHEGRRQVITNGSRVRSYDLVTGKLLWQCGGQASNPIPTPLAEGGLVYCMTGFRGFAVYALPLGATGDITGSDQIAWHRNEGTPYIASPILYNGLLYYTRERSAMLSIADPKTGELSVDRQRMPGLTTLYASPVAADQRIYYVDRAGTTLVLRHGPRLEVLATNSLDEGIDASPIIVGRQLLLRGEQHLYAIETQ